METDYIFNVLPSGHVHAGPIWVRAGLGLEMGKWYPQAPYGFSVGPKWEIYVDQILDLDLNQRLGPIRDTSGLNGHGLGIGEIV